MVFDEGGNGDSVMKFHADQATFLLGIRERSECRIATFLLVLKAPKISFSCLFAAWPRISRAWSPCVASTTWSKTSVLSFTDRKTTPSFPRIRLVTLDLRCTRSFGKSARTASIYCFVPPGMVIQGARALTVLR